MTDLTTYVRNISEFVREAMGTPHKAHIDWWLESTYAALFSSSFELLLIHVSCESPSFNEFNNTLQSFIKDIADKTSSWIEKEYLQSLPGQLHGKFMMMEGAFNREIQNRLNHYFAIGLTAISDKNFDIETARSHSCFAVLSKISKDTSKDIFKHTIEFCESLANDMHQAIKSRR